MIELLYGNASKKVIINDSVTEAFDVNTGIFQGDTLAPYLFFVTIDYCMRTSIADDEEDIYFPMEERTLRRSLSIGRCEYEASETSASLISVPWRIYKRLSHSKKSWGRIDRRMARRRDGGMERRRDGLADRRTDGHSFS